MNTTYTITSSCKLLLVVSLLTVCITFVSPKILAAELNQPCNILDSHTKLVFA
jgi:hypothetical protein